MSHDGDMATLEVPGRVFYLGPSVSPDDLRTKLRNANRADDDVTITVRDDPSTNLVYPVTLNPHALGWWIVSDD